jgi:hypothetical protein
MMGAVIMLILNELLQVGCCNVPMTEELYRLLAFRYLFLAFLGYYFLKSRIRIYTYLLFFMIGVVYQMSVGHVDYVPFLYDSWMTQQLPAFFYTLGLMKLLLVVYERIKELTVGRFFVQIGTHSWAIFLLQMFFLTVTSVSWLSFVSAPILQQLLYVMMIYGLCVVPVIAYDYYQIKSKNE